MYSLMSGLKAHAACAIILIASTLVTAPGFAADFICTGPQMGDLFIDTQTGSVTKSAEETQTVEIATENSNYRFEFKGKKNQFKAIINRANGQIILDQACTPECWGGPIFGTCSTVIAKF